MSKIIVVCIGLLYSLVSIAQINHQNNQKALSYLIVRLDLLDTSAMKQEVNDSIQHLLSSILQTDQSFEPNTERIGKVQSPDGMVQVFTWNYQDIDLSYRYGGLIQFKKSKKEKAMRIALVDRSNTIKETGFIRPDEWYGALYYDIVVKDYKRTRYYTLLGWDGNDGVIARKIIDNFSIDKRNKIKFGYPLFRYQGKVRSRVSFQFNAQGSMMLAYDDAYKRIVFDHLSPNVPDNKDRFEYYGPDFTYDGFRFRKGKWWFEQNIDVRNKDR